MEKRISVIVPIYNGEKFLPELFRCLDACDFRPGDEVLLVDNNSTDATAAICAEKQAQRPALYKLLTYKDQADSYASRNHAVRAAQGDIFAFTDSDCKPTVQWLECVRSRLQPGRVMAGEVLLEIQNHGLWESFDAVTHLSQSRAHIQENRVATANMAVHREDFFRVGYFEERFAGGDFAWSEKAGQKGLEIFYCPEALIYHPSRKTYEEILTRERRGAYGAGKAQKKAGGSLLPLALRYFLKIFKLDTYVRLHGRLQEKGVAPEELKTFYGSFFRIRCEQLKSAIHGYRGVDARSIGVK